MLLYEMEPLHELLFPGIKLTVAFDDLSPPLPPMQRPDVRQLVIEKVLESRAGHRRPMVGRALEGLNRRKARRFARSETRERARRNLVGLLGRLERKNG